MFSAVLGLFSQDLAIDMGTTNTRIYQRGGGIVCDTPTAAAIETDALGRRRIIAFGNEAIAMRGRTPAGITVVEPVFNGKVVNYEVAEALLTHLMRQLHGRNGFISPRIVASVPYDEDQTQHRAFKESCEGVGARRVSLVSAPIAAAIGTSLPIAEPTGHMIVDIGGGYCGVSIIASGSVVHHLQLRGGNGMDEAIIKYIALTHSLAIGRSMARKLRESVSLLSAIDEGTLPIKGLCTRRKVPRCVNVDPGTVREALTTSITAITIAIKRALEAVDPSISSDIVNTGIILTGGIAKQKGIERRLRNLTGLPVVKPPQPEMAILRGLSELLEDHSDLPNFPGSGGSGGTDDPRTQPPAQAL